MKPLKLAMSAFGSYADVQTIDFTKLGANGLYLITGETGAGKTTIFDGISFALFGKASGAGRDDYSMLRSDFVTEKAKTFVELDFACGPKQYNIKRSIKKAGQNVVLTLPGGGSLSGDRNVKQKIAEIIGLDRDQFAQIVMIAQNDFLRFLQSGTDERLKILRRIFGTETLKQFQENLKTLMKSESDKRELILHDFERYKVDVYHRDEQFAQWEAQIKADRAEISEADRRLELLDKQKQSLAAALAVAEELCGKFAGLAKCRLDLEGHHTKAEEIVKIKTRAARGEISLYKVKPLADKAHKALADHSAARTGLTSAEKRKTAANIELEQATKAMEGLPPLAEAQEALAVLMKEWETAGERYKRLTSLRTNRDEIVGKRDTLTKTQGELSVTVEELGKLPPISDCQANLDKIVETLKTGGDKLVKLSALQNNLNEISDRQSKLNREQRSFESLDKDYRAADEKYRTLEQSFLRCQAGLMANHLIDGEPCPVCGSVDHPAPALLPDGSVTETQLKKASEVRDKAQLKYQAIATKCGALRVEIETMSRRFVPDLSVYIPDVTVETAAVALPKTLDEIGSAVMALTEKRRRAEKTLSALKIKSEKTLKKHDQLTAVIAPLQSEIDTLTKRFILDFSDFVPDAGWETAESKLNGLWEKTHHTVKELTSRKEADRKALETLTAQWDAAVKRKTKAESAAAAAHTLVTERTENEQRLCAYNAQAQASYTTALQENGFATEEQYETALITEKELSKLNRRVSDYEKKGEQLTRDIARLEEETADKDQPDIEKLRVEAQTVHAETKNLGAARDVINSRLSKTDSALQELRRAASNFEKVEKTYAAVKQLADTANGKLDFETYAQLAYFERVIRAANHRLKLMSQNRYTLLRKTDSADGRRRSGLELEVMDAFTGKARSANSLSGGESFMASLSLALGLSDIVQHSAGGVHLDAMFIDEGFGSLDTEVLELAVRTLSEMAGANRIVGVISHVAELRERIDRQVRVEKTTTGSKITLAV